MILECYFSYLTCMIQNPLNPVNSTGMISLENVYILPILEYSFITLRLMFLSMFFCRDLTDIGVYLKVIEGCQQLDKETR